MTNSSQQLIERFCEICLRAGIDEDKIKETIKNLKEDKQQDVKLVDSLHTLYPYL